MVVTSYNHTFSEEKTPTKNFVLGKIFNIELYFIGFFKELNCILNHSVETFNEISFYL